MTLKADLISDYQSDALDSLPDDPLTLEESADYYIKKGKQSRVPAQEPITTIDLSRTVVYDSVNDIVKGTTFSDLFTVINELRPNGSTIPRLVLRTDGTVFDGAKQEHPALADWKFDETIGAWTMGSGGGGGGGAIAKAGEIIECDRLSGWGKAKLAVGGSFPSSLQFQSGTAFSGDFLSASGSDIILNASEIDSVFWNSLVGKDITLSADCGTPTRNIVSWNQSFGSDFLILVVDSTPLGCGPGTYEIAAESTVVDVWLGRNPWHRGGDTVVLVSVLGAWFVIDKIQGFHYTEPEEEIVTDPPPIAEYCEDEVP